MKRLALAATFAGLLMLPGVARAGASTDAALGLGAFAVFNQILSGTGIFGGTAAVAAPAPVVVTPPPAPVYAAPAPVYVPAPRPVYVAPPPPPVAYVPAPPVAYVPAPPVAYVPAPPVAYVPAPPVAYVPAPPVYYGRPVYYAPRPHFVRGHRWERWDHRH